MMLKFQWKMRALIFFHLLAYVYISHAALPTGDELLQMLQATYLNVDADHDGRLSRAELAAFPGQADLNQDGCMSLAEYKMVKSASNELTETVYHSLDPGGSDCLNYAKISIEFDKLDTDKNGYANFQEFSDWFTTLMFGHPVDVVG